VIVAVRGGHPKVLDPFLIVFPQISILSAEYQAVRFHRFGERHCAGGPPTSVTHHGKLAVIPVAAKVVVRFVSAVCGAEESVARLNGL